MKIDDFISLKELTKGEPILLFKGDDYAESIYKANIPFRPGVYLVYSLNESGDDHELLYYGKAGVTNIVAKSMLNFHQLPIRLLAATPRPASYTLSKKEFVTRARLWPWYVDNEFIFGIKIYWFITEWPEFNPIEIERAIKYEILDNNPKWRKKI
tara:strand:+ start:597 stop:1061 length:465 start_codon:yes stop_codon:yes gene_type:complete